jgi:ATP-binding cassette subfamily B protein
VRRGDRILLEGPSGGGKSTFAALLAGLRTPNSGTLLAGGLDRDTLGVPSWRRFAVAIPQFHDNHIFTGTLAFNLLLGHRWPPSPRDLVAAETICRELGLGPLIDGMPVGIFQVVGDGGWQLSHGEMSRVSLARGLLQSPELLIVDESLGALDSSTVRQCLECLAERTSALLVVAHP